MSRILLADDSPNAQRMGERILREEGFEVVSVTDGATAFVRLTDVDPDVILADAFLPTRSGFDLCRHVKTSPELRHIHVILTAGMLEDFNEDEAQASGADGIIRKPFEASVLTEMIQRMVDSSQSTRGLVEEHKVEQQSAVEIAVAEAIAAERSRLREIDPERVRAAITIALDAALPQMIDEITERVLIALGH